MHRLKACAAAAFLVVGPVGAAMAADSFTISHGVCGGGSCAGPSPTAACTAYAQARVAYSQGNPADFNKWTLFDSLVAPSPAASPLNGCAAIGSCGFTLQAQSGYRQNEQIGVQQCAAVPVVEIDRTQDPPPKGDACYGNPIYPLTGVKRELVDLGLRVGWMPLSVTYDTSRKAPTTTTGAAAAPAPEPMSFGALWYGSSHRRVMADAGMKGAVVARGHGRVVSFTGNGQGVYTADPNVNDKLTRVAAGYLYVDSEAKAIESYDAEGTLLRIDHAGGQSLTFSTSNGETPAEVAPGIGYLLSIVDGFGRTIRFNYGAGGLVSQVVDATGLKILTDYSSGRLSQLIWPNDSRRQFMYENATLPWAMTGVVDERGTRFSTFGYSPDGRVISTERALGTGRFSVSYASPPAVAVTESYDAVNNVIHRIRTWQPPVDPEVSTPETPAIRLGVSVAGHQPVVATRSQPAGSGCNASTSRQSFDVNGNIASADDFNGTRTCHAHDMGRNVETTRVQGLTTTAACAPLLAANAALPAGTRKISTQWHPDWRLQARVAEPRQIVTTVYNGQPDPTAGNAIAACAPASATLPGGKPIVVPCKKVVQATTDANGAQGFAAPAEAGVPMRVWRWTYNSAGQVLTEDGPRTDVADTSSYAYHAATVFTGSDPKAVGVTRGDLKSVTNAAGRTTQYTKYDKHGQLLESIDPNGVVSSYAYDVRQRLLSHTVGGQRTSYIYDAAGQLVRVTAPDGSFVGYGYDAARRLVAVFDHLNNRIDYTLDNAGNRTAEAVKDPGGALKRQLARSFDALGRVQQTTGRE